MYSYTPFHPSQEGKHILQRAERCCLFLSPQKHQGPASFFCREAEVLFGALKRKSCLSVASSFSLAEKSTGVGKKMQTANFLFVSFFFCSGKRKMKNHLHSYFIHYLSVEQVNGTGSITCIVLRVSYHYHSCTFLV